jgi:hypothetical protein
MKCRANGKLVDEYKIHDDGYEASEMGVPIDGNPYHIKSRAYVLWHGGWWDYDLDVRHQDDKDGEDE